MRSRTRAVLAVVFALVLVGAGCSSPTEPQTSTPADGATQPSGDYPSRTTQAQSTTPSEPRPPSTATQRPPSAPELPDGWEFDVGRTFQRVQSLLETNATAPGVTVSATLIAETESQRFDPGQRPELVLFGLAEADTAPADLTGFTPSGDSVVLSPNMTGARAESVLAHEYVHTIQQQQFHAWVPKHDGDTLVRRYPSRGMERGLLWRALWEGSANYLQVTYDQQYLPERSNGSSIDAYLDGYRSWYRNRSGASQYFAAPYYYGTTYLAGRIDDPAAIPAVLDSAPLTTEQLLHAETPATEPAMALSVSMGGNASLSRDGDYSPSGTNGELFTRLVLDQELARDRAIAAAAGWGNDLMLWAVPTDGTSGYVWVTRWDTPGEADQFEAAITDYGRQRPDSVTFRNRTQPSAVASERPSDDVVVVYVGSDSLPGQFSVRVDGGDVTLVPTA